MPEIRYEQTARAEWHVLLDGVPIGFIFRGRRVNARQHLWYAFDLGYESLGMEHFRRRDALADLLAHHNHERQRQ